MVARMTVVTLTPSNLPPEGKDGLLAGEELPLLLVEETLIQKRKGIFFFFFKENFANTCV